ncbi:hypothetical protein E8E12_000333 [Didymella heteroderae]|uniref:Fungal N-terminal domain-containing protein n=1 Tax=Didymella heteroderae TaxID=1769908 RepID=A0A9P4WFD9_9PLEO|nr:hypothetical protein E8E12_000333 [Didymella heteroderae]
MEVIGGTAAVSQLLGQAITIIQKIQDARAKVHGAADHLDGYQDQLENLLSTLQLVQGEPELQTRPIEKQVQKIINLGRGLQRQLDAFAAQLTRSKARQYTHAMFSGDKDERELETALTQLDRAKSTLNAMIVTTHVGLSGSMRAGFEVALAVVQRVDWNVQSVVGERLCMAAHLEERRMGEEGDNTVSLTAEEVKAMNFVDKVSWVDNEAFDDATLFESDLVERQIHAPTERLYKGNKAHGRRSQQPYGRSPDLPTQAATASPRLSMDPVSSPLDRSPFLGAVAASQIPDTQLTGDASISRSEPSALHSPCPTVVYHEIADDLRRDACSAERVRPLAGKLELLELDEWNENETYDEEPPTCLHYSIEWKVTLNNKVMSRDTEPDLVLAPRFYWSLFLRDKLKKLLQKKLPPSKRVACEDTNVVVSVTKRSQHDLTKRFDKMDIDWFLVERQLSQWSESFRAGKKLRVDVTFNYVELGQPAPVASKRGGKRGYPSATQQMLAERDSQVDAEEEMSSQPSI